MHHVNAVLSCRLSSSGVSAEFASVSGAVAAHDEDGVGQETKSAMTLTKSSQMFGPAFSARLSLRFANYDETMAFTQPNSREDGIDIGFCGIAV